jgi:hypothetical protein
MKKAFGGSTVYPEVRPDFAHKDYGKTDWSIPPWVAFYHVFAQGSALRSIRQRRCGWGTTAGAPSSIREAFTLTAFHPRAADRFAFEEVRRPWTGLSARRETYQGHLASVCDGHWP